jgi:hypothetical protein
MKAVRSIAVIMLAMLVLVSSTSVMVGMHLCMGEIENIAFFSKADGCEKEKSLPPCHRDTTPPCCDDETVILKSDDFKTSTTKSQVVVLASNDIPQPLVVLAEIIPATPIASFRYYQYDPPLRTPDLTVEHRVFLI